MDWYMTILRFLHVCFAVVWVGGTAFMVLFFQPGMRRVDPDARRPVMLAVGPRVAIGLLISAAAVFLTGVLMVLDVLTMNHLDRLWHTAWGWSISLGFLVATAMFLTGLMYVVRNIFRMKAMAEGDNPPTFEELRSIQAQMRYGAMVALTFGILAIFTMVVARGYNP